MEPVQRKEKILSAIVEGYIKTGEPIGSKALISATGLEVSSATVRNDMADLTQKGYLVQPHTSAGRVPTQQGYRYYVDNIMAVPPVSQRGRDYIEARLIESADSPESILKKAAKVISELTGFSAVTTTPNGRDSRIYRISFVQTGLHTAMAVVIASSGIIKTKLFRCEFVITPDILNVFDKALNEVFAGVRLDSINKPFIQTAAARFGELSLFMPGVLVAIMEAAKGARDVSVFKSGVTRLLFASDVNPIRARGVIEFLNTDHDLAKMLENLPPHTSVSIGSENSRVELCASSVVSTRYDVDSNPSGALAVLGPVRMDYGRVISILECAADCVSKMIDGLTDANSD